MRLYKLEHISNGVIMGPETGFYPMSHNEALNMRRAQRNSTDWKIVEIIY